MVLNCAAYTNVDGAESEPEQALLVNGEAAGIVAEAAPAVLYVSSDYVFDGRKGEPYVESDPTGPASSYGRSKLAGEQATAAANPRHFIVRSSWLFGAGGKNFVDTMLRVGRERDEARVVADQVGCPTYTGHLARALVEIAVRRRLRHPPRGRRRLVLVVRPRRGRLRARRRGLPARSRSPPRSTRCPRRGPPTRCSAPSASRCLPAWQEGLDAYLAEREVHA